MPTHQGTRVSAPFSRKLVELLSGLGFVLASVCVVLAPILDLAGALEPIDVLSAPAVQVAEVIHARDRPVPRAFEVYRTGRAIH